MSAAGLTHLQRLEAESIHILREVVAEAERPVMLYSVGKDSAVMLHLAKKAFFPSPPPFPLLHVDTTWKFRAMYALRDKAARDAGMELIVYQNPEAKERGINPFDHGPLHTDLWKTQGLKQALDAHGFDLAFGGARRDEEKSRAKERVFSFRSAQHQWDPRNQRPELWRLYNARKHAGESIRVFPLSNWTELDVWQYIFAEKIPIVPLYLAAEREVVRRDGTWIMVDDERFRLREGEHQEDADGPQRKTFARQLHQRTAEAGDAEAAEEDGEPFPDLAELEAGVPDGGIDPRIDGQQRSRDPPPRFPRLERTTHSALPTR